MSIAGFNNQIQTRNAIIIIIIIIIIILSTCWSIESS